MVEDIKGSLKVMRDGEIKVDHCGGYLYFVPPFEGLGTYPHIRSKIEERKLGRPTMGECASLIYACLLNANESFAIELLDRMHSPFWVNTIRYETDHGIFAIDHPSLNESGEVIIPENFENTCFSREELASRDREDTGVHYCSAVYDGDRITRVENSIRMTAPESYVGDILSSELYKSRVIRAEAGRQGLAKLAEIARRQNEKVFIGGTNNQPGRRIKIPALYFSDGRLVIAGDDYNSDRKDGWCIGIDRNRSNLKPDSPKLIE